MFVILVLVLFDVFVVGTMVGGAFVFIELSGIVMLNRELV